MKEIADEHAFALAMHVILGGMTMADKRLLLEESTAISAFLAVNYGIDNDTIQKAHSAFMARLHKLAAGDYDTLVSDAFKTLQKYCGIELERKRCLVRLLYTLANIDGVVVEAEDQYAKMIARAFGLSEKDLSDCARVGTQAGELMRQWAGTVNS